MIQESIIPQKTSEQPIKFSEVTPINVWQTQRQLKQKPSLSYLMNFPRLSSEKRFYILFFSSLLVFLLCSLISHDSSQTSQFSQKRFLSRNLETIKPRKLEVTNDTLIGWLDTFAFEPKFLKLDIFEISVKDRMVVKCFYSGECHFEETVHVDDTHEFHPDTAILHAPHIVPIWKAFSLLNVLVLKKEREFSNDMVAVTQDLKAVLEVLLGFKTVLISQVQQFLTDIITLVLEQLSNVSSQILLDLGDINSELSLEFQQILANAFSIVVGQYLQQISSDYLFFDQALSNILRSIETDISTNSQLLANYIPRQDVLDAIEAVRQNYSSKCYEFIEELNKYVNVQNNWTAIITEQIQTQIIEKFNFPDENITVAVQNFLIMVIETRRNLITDTGSLISQQLNLYVSTFAAHVTQNNQTLQNDLQNLINAINQVSNPTNPDDINTIFLGDNGLGEALFDVHKDLDVLGTLTTITSVQFADVLTQFQEMFLKYISNLPEIIQIVTQTFYENYVQLLAEIQGLATDAHTNLTQAVAQLWVDVYQATNVTARMIDSLTRDDYNLTEEEQQEYERSNLFNDTIAPAILEIQANRALISSLIDQITADFTQLNTNATLTFNTSLPLLTQEILDNITALINQVEQEKHQNEQDFINLLQGVEDALGLASTSDFIQFLTELTEYIDNNYQSLVQIIEAILTNNFTKITLLGSDVVTGITHKFQDSFAAFEETPMSDTPVEFSSSKSIQYVNFSGEGLHSNLELDFNFHQVVNSYYSLIDNDNIMHFDFYVIPSVEFHVDVINKFQELYLFKDVITTAIDLLNGTASVSYHKKAMFDDQKNLTSYVLEELAMNDLQLNIEEEYSFFIQHNETSIDPLLKSQTASLQPVTQTVGSSSCNL